MANKKLTQLPFILTIGPNDVIYVVQGGVSYQMATSSFIRDSILDFTIPTGVVAGLVGLVSPEGSVAAPPGITYFDTVLNAFYVKKNTSTNTGWIQLI
jgi:hypothetical protein